MAREAAQRFDSAEAMIGELDSWAAGVGLEVPRTSSLPSMIPEAAARTALRTTSPPRPTGSSWAMSQHPTRNARSALPLVLGAAAVAAALLGAGLYGAYRLLGAHDHAAIPAASPPASGLVVPSVASNKPVHESTGSSDDEVEPGGGEPPKHLAGDAHSGPQVRPVEAPSRPPSTGTVNPDAAKVDDASQAASRKTLAPTRQPARSAKKKLPDFGY
jgi:cytoskeletal protein RodZ